MKGNLEKIFFTFFGAFELPKGYVILTPINKIYEKIKAHYPLIEETKGWWKRTKIKVNSNPVTILKVPLGSHIKDCFEIFVPSRIRKIILLGFCGALNQNLQVGEVVIPKTAVLEKLKINSLVKLEIKYKIATTSQMILGSKFLKKFQDDKIDIIDMETYYLYEWGRKKNIPVISILLVTDKPFSLPFFDCSQPELLKIRKGIKDVVKRLDKYLYFNLQN